MPTYQYSCTECGHFFEAVQSFSDDSLTVCPECDGRLRKVFNAVGVVFKGSGFYRTDSRGAAPEAGAAASTGDSPTVTKADAPAAAKTATKTETKPTTSASASTD